MKKFIFILVAAVMIISAIPVSAENDASPKSIRQAFGAQAVEFARLNVSEKTSIVIERINAIKQSAIQYAACRSSNSENCTRTRQEVFNASKTAVINSIDAAIRHLTNLQDKIESSKNINQSLSVNLSAEINASIDGLVILKSRVENTTNITEIKNIISDLRNQLRWAILRTETHLMQMKRADTRDVIVRAAVLEERMNRLRSFLQARGVEVDSALYSKFSARIDEARLYVSNQTFERVIERKRTAEADRLISGNDIQQVKAVSAEARESLRKARDALFEANKVLVTIITESINKSVAANVSIGANETELADADADVSIGSEV